MLAFHLGIYPRVDFPIPKSRISEQYRVSVFLTLLDNASVTKDLYYLHTHSFSFSPTLFIVGILILAIGWFKFACP